MHKKILSKIIVFSALIASGAFAQENFYLNYPSSTTQPKAGDLSIWRIGSTDGDSAPALPGASDNVFFTTGILSLTKANQFLIMGDDILNADRTQYIAEYNNLTIDYTPTSSAGLFEICSNSANDIGSKLIINGTFEQLGKGTVNLRKATKSTLDVEINNLVFSNTGTIKFGSSSTNTVRNLSVNTLTTNRNGSINIHATEQAYFGELNLKSNLDFDATNSTVNVGSIDQKNYLTFVTSSGGSITTLGDHTILSRTDSDGNTQINTLNLARSATSVYTVKGNFIVNKDAGVKVRGVGGGFVIEKSLTVNGSFGFDDYYNGANLRDYEISVGNISGGDGTENVRIYTTYSDTTEYGNLTININGGGESLYSSRIHDFGKDTTADNITSLLGAKINLVVNGDSTLKQYLTGQNYIRGDVSVINGTLMLNADGTTNAAGKGVGNIYLNGGAFGAVGAGQDISSVNNIGVVKAESLTWSGSAKILVDVEGGSADTIIIDGMFAKGDGDQFVFDFTVDGSDPLGEYKIMSWDTTDFTASDFTAMLNGEETDKIIFSMRDNALYADFSQIPEPSQVAAFLGFVALTFAAYRKRAKRN